MQSVEPKQEQPGGTHNKRAVNWLTKQTAATITKRTAGKGLKAVRQREKRTCFFSVREKRGGQAEEMGTERDMEGFKKLARTAALNSLPYQNSDTHRGSTQQTTCPLPALSFSLALPLLASLSPHPFTAHTSEVRQRRRLPCAASLCGPKKLF